MDEIGRYVRENDRPFGGIQLVLCGDFYQLPPVAVPFPHPKTQKDDSCLILLV